VAKTITLKDMIQNVKYADLYKEATTHE